MHPADVGRHEVDGAPGGRRHSTGRHSSAWPGAASVVRARGALGSPARVDGRAHPDVPFVVLSRARSDSAGGRVLTPWVCRSSGGPPLAHCSRSSDRRFDSTPVPPGVGVPDGVAAYPRMPPSPPPPSFPSNSLGSMPYFCSRLASRSVSTWSGRSASACPALSCSPWELQKLDDLCLVDLHDETLHAWGMSDPTLLAPVGPATRAASCVLLDPSGTAGT